MGSPNYNFELPDPPPFATKPIPISSDKKLLRLQKINLLTSLLLVTGFLISSYALGFICGSLQRIEAKLNSSSAAGFAVAPGSTADTIADDLEQTRQILQQAEQMFSPVEENNK